MKPNTSRFEMLLFTNTGISKKQLAEKKNESRNDTFSPAEELEKQCWAGLLSELLAEIIPSFSQNRNIYIWSIIAESNYILISMGPHPQPMASPTALDPHVLLPEFLLN